MKYSIILIAVIAFSCTQTETKTARIIREVNEKEIKAGNQWLALAGATLIDGNGGQPISNAIIIVHGDRIEAVGKAGEVNVPAGAEKVDLTGLTILPGLIDSHYHNERSINMAALYASRGITSVRDPGAWMEAYDSARMSGKPLPRLFLTGPHINTYPPAYPEDCIIVKDPEESRLAVEKLVGQGATAIKAYFGLSVAMIREVCATAHRHGIPVTGHLETANAVDAIEAGLDGIEHITSFGICLVPMKQGEKYKQSIMADNAARGRGRYVMWNSMHLDRSPKADSLVRFIVKKKTFVSPTLAVFEKQSDLGDSIDVNGFANMVKFTGMVHHGGGTVVVGSHTGVPYAETGYAYFREMELLHEAGLSNTEVIQSATINNARFFRIDERLGSLEKGKLADLIVISGDPLADLKAMRQIKRVMLNGVWIPADSR